MRITSATKKSKQSHLFGIKPILKVEYRAALREKSVEREKFQNFELRCTRRGKVLVTRHSRQRRCIKARWEFNVEFYWDLMELSSSLLSSSSSLCHSFPPFLSFYPCVVETKLLMRANLWFTLMTYPWPLWESARGWAGHGRNYQPIASRSRR